MMKSGEIDAVLIVTPHYSHTPLTIAAFESGLHVLCEKPIAVHKADAEKMIEAHKKCPELKFAAMFQMRTGGIYKKIKKMIDSGELGKIYRVNWILTNWFRSQIYYDSGGWRATWKGEGGGVLLNQSPHQLDLFQWFFGMPSKVKAFCSIGKYHNIEVEDDVTAFLEFEDEYSGIFITSTGEAPGTNRLEIAAENGRLGFENGKIIFDRTEIPVGEFSRNTESGFGIPPIGKFEITPEEGDGSHQKIIENFADSILNGAELIAKGEEGIKSVVLANSMLLSSLNNETVELPLDAEKFANTLQKLIDNSTFVKPEERKSNEDFSSSFIK